MEDPRWIRLVTIGLVLAAMAVGYFLLTGGLSGNKSKVAQTQTGKAVQSPSPRAVSAPAASPSVLVQATPTPNPSPSSAYDLIVNRSQGNIQTLPKTGFPVGLVVIFSVSAIISGWSLRKYPH